MRLAFFSTMVTCHVSIYRSPRAIARGLWSINTARPPLKDRVYSGLRRINQVCIQLSFDKPCTASVTLSFLLILLFLRSPLQQRRVR
jgi:hypothetical protein